MRTIHDNLRMLNILVSTIGEDIESFLKNPKDFDVSEYFDDMLTDANEAQELVEQIRNQLKEKKKPVAIHEGRDLYWISGRAPKDSESDGFLYLVPPKNEWVRLTNGEIAEAVKIMERGNFMVAIHNIETRLKEKNT